MTLRFIRRARDLGFSMKRTRRLIDLWQDKSRSKADVKRLALDHIAELSAKLAALQRSELPSSSSLMHVTAMKSDNAQYYVIWKVQRRRDAAADRTAFVRLTVANCTRNLIGSLRRRVLESKTAYLSTAAGLSW